MLKRITVILLSLILLVVISFAVQADSTTISQPVASPQYATHYPTDSNQHQALVKAITQKNNVPSNAVNSTHSSKLANFETFVHNKIVKPIKSGWQHFKNLKIWKHHSQTTPSKN